jgi:imidazolonepropionase-like amidohydrolase
MEAIRCATRNAADVLGDLKNRGTPEPGKRADFLILDADIPNTTRLAAVYRGGKRVEPKFQEEFTPSTSPGP